MNSQVSSTLIQASNQHSQDILHELQQQFKDLARNVTLLQRELSLVNKHSENNFKLFLYISVCFFNIRTNI